MKHQIKLCTFVGKYNLLSMNRIREVLDSKEISQTELAKFLDKTFNMVNLYTTNKVNR